MGKLQWLRWEPSDNQGSDTRRGGGLVLSNLIGQCGPILGTRIFPTSESPRYVKCLSICAAFMGLTAVMALGLRVLLVWENKRLDAEYKDGGRREKDEAVAVVNYSPNFWYVL